MSAARPSKRQIIILLKNNNSLGIIQLEKYEAGNGHCRSPLISWEIYDWLMVS